MLHPATGVFDVVVVQPSAAGAFPEVAGVLTGRPIYTVYLNVGAPKEWLLQYCLPGQSEASQQVNSSVIQLGTPSPVKPPYPQLTLRIPVVLPEGTPHLFVHGFLDTNGEFKNLELVRDPKTGIGTYILSLLRRWQFRPATRDGRPVLVEILLAIPPDKT